MSDDEFTANNHLPAVLGHVEVEAKRYIGYGGRDLLGRMTVPFNEIEDLFDEVPDGTVIDAAQAERLHSSLFELAALVAATLAMLEVEHPELLDKEQ
ncbi:hypothetical protein GO308_09880 [Sphingomonas sp. SFZ2018-12]|uniref:hypothetical protein n=1 Tax=Sphingomonas sp. SFZ2018-12 TaxID=2683197 RepID=UPI001F0EE613|nr:hypothetical protein [Sphingomonas sp. SFZ2018-12]MCH4893417.1 hypothetical protein [Sphingomonas sp. SFZ2018-12]